MYFVSHACQHALHLSTQQLGNEKWWEGGWMNVHGPILLDVFIHRSPLEINWLSLPLRSKSIQPEWVHVGGGRVISCNKKGKGLVGKCGFNQSLPLAIRNRFQTSDLLAYCRHGQRKPDTSPWTVITYLIHLFFHSFKKKRYWYSQDKKQRKPVET